MAISSGHSIISAAMNLCDFDPYLADFELTSWEAEGDIVKCESVPGKTGSSSVSSYSSHSMMAIHYVPLSPRVEQGNMSRSPFGTPVTAAV